MLCSRPPLAAPPLRGAARAALALGALALTGCDPDCSSPSRIDGEWSVLAQSTDDAWRISGFGSDEDAAERAAQAQLLSQLMVNGERQWTLKYVPGSDTYNLSIDGQRFEAEAEPAPDHCNQLALQVEGSWEGEAGSAHEFTLKGDLLWTGDRLAGTFSYADAWTWEGRTGEVRLPAGELSAARGEAEGD